MIIPTFGAHGLHRAGRAPRLTKAMVTLMMAVDRSEMSPLIRSNSAFTTFGTHPLEWQALQLE